MKKLFVLLVLFLLSNQVFAFRVETCNGGLVKWSTNTRNIAADPATIPANQTAWNLLQRAITQINRNPSNFQMSMTALPTAITNQQAALDNASNEVFFSVDPTIMGNLTAFASVNISGCNQTSVDVIFHRRPSDVSPPGTNWSYSTTVAPTTSYGGQTGYGGILLPFVSAAMHEFGHFSGLNHEERYYNMMGSDDTHIYRNGNNAETTSLGEDASNGLVALYGLNAATRQDLGLTHWVRAGISGEYSVHRRVPVYSSTGTVLACSPQYGTTCTRDQSEGDQYFRVNRGQVVNVNFGYENNGRDSKTVLVRYYVSVDNTITSTDILIGEKSYTLVRDLPNYYNYTMTIPTNLTPSTATTKRRYYIGAIIDANNAVAEVNEANNTTYTGIEVY